jgi:hypothetical protein
MKYHVDRALHRGGEDVLSGVLPSPWELWWADVERVERRTSPFELQASRLKSKATVKLPEGFVFTSATAADQSDAKDRFVTWDLNTKASNDGEWRLDAKQTGGEFAAGDYATYYDEAQQLIDALNRPVTIQLRR